MMKKWLSCTAIVVINMQPKGVIADFADKQVGLGLNSEPSHHASLT